MSESKKLENRIKKQAEDFPKKVEELENRQKQSVLDAIRHAETERQAVEKERQEGEHKKKNLWKNYGGE